MAEPVAQPARPRLPALPPGLAERLLNAADAARLPRLITGRELARGQAPIHRELPLPTSLPQIDRLLGGGLERGALTELVGGRSSGRFAAVLAAIAAATAAGEAAALVDLGGNLDPQVAATLGCGLERLLWVRPERMRDALLAVELLLKSGFPLVVLDLGTPPIPGGCGPESFWVRLARAAAEHRAALLVAAPFRSSGTAASTVLRARRTRAAWDGRDRAPRLLRGLGTEVVLEKLRHRATQTVARLALAAPGTLCLPRPHPDPLPAGEGATTHPESTSDGTRRSEPIQIPTQKPRWDVQGTVSGADPGARAFDEVEESAYRGPAGPLDPVLLNRSLSTTSHPAPP